MRKRTRRLTLTKETLRALDAGAPSPETQADGEMTSTVSQCTVSGQNGACTAGIACGMGQCVAVRPNFNL